MDRRTKRIVYCEWHIATSHNTNDRKVFRQQIQSAIEQDILKFDIPTKPAKPMKIYGYPYPVNMVAPAKGNTLQTKLLTSKSAKNKGIVDPRVQISAADVKGKDRQEECASSRAPQRWITSQGCINKYQRQQEKERHDQEMMHWHEDLWRCPFFIYCRGVGSKLPSPDNCPECNGHYCDNRSYKKPHFDDKEH